MFELVVASGKGGTGKTSLVAALAEFAGRSALVDCDVDAANLHLIVPHEVRQEHDFSASRRAAIDPDRCVACGICLDACRFGAIGMEADPDSRWGVRFSVDPLACEGCGLCMRLCETEAVTFDKVISGQWFESESDYGPFLHARLGIAESNSGRLVSLLRQRSRELAAARGLNTIIVDGPPGIGCPVIAALTNASYLLIVTEPSLSAIHDMERLAELADHFRLKAGICVNKCDIDEEISDQVTRFAADRGLAVLGTIPYDPAFTQAQLRGVSYLQTGSAETIARIRNIWQSVRSIADPDGAADHQRFAV